MAQPCKPGEIYWRFVERYYWLPLNESWDRGPAAFLAALRPVPAKAQHLYACHWCLSEVRNGGFWQFFYNTTGILAPEAVAGFGAVGAVELAALVAEPVSYFGPHYPRDRDIRLSVLPQPQGDAFAGSDAKVYAWLHAKRDRWDLLADAYARDA